jgi:hypothetical protein
MWATRVSNSLFTTSLLTDADLPLVRQVNKQPDRNVTRAGGCIARMARLMILVLAFLSMSFSMSKFNRPNQATTNDKSVGQLGTPSFDQLVQFIYTTRNKAVQLVILVFNWSNESCL